MSLLYIRNALFIHDGDVAKASKAIKLHRTTMYRILKADNHNSDTARVSDYDAAYHRVFR